MTALAAGHRFADTPLAILGPDDVAAYAEASGDHNPIHLDEQAARAAGLPGTIVHGMLIMGRLEGAIRSWLPQARLARLSTRFVKPLAVGDGIVIGGRIVRLRPQEDGGSELLLRLTVANGAGTMICVGEAALHLDAEA
ncbi:MaoC/PaaZ C-terminal domain-containing protein [Stappia sp. WLB 29]|uniref:MaoC family dehydratase n=1 Tax=Stappia sp. WLB 29 TaxID=2925220 RepID=UPI0020BE0FF2|nr:MaoC/PaaZ C-terminal domain-containing protein [Stappia sp. WLB 29]